MDAVLAGRDVRLDLFRGISLWFLFLEQTPPTNASPMTLEAEKFSVATAIFILVFGYTAGLVYGRVMREQGLHLATAQILRRAWQVYVAQVLLFVFHIIQIDSMSRGNPRLAEITKVAVFVQQPFSGLFHGMLLDYQPSNTEVLAIYIVLLLAFSPMLWLLLREPVLALAASISVYVLASVYGWNLPAYPAGEWTLNPFTWQLLFVVGAWFGLGQTHGIERILLLRTTRALAVSYLIVAIVAWIGSFAPALGAFRPGWLNVLIHPSSPTALDVVVLLHVASIAAVAVWLVPQDLSAFAMRALRPVLLCGRYPLATLCFGVFLAFASRSLFAVSNLRATHVAFVVGGIVLMATLARFLAWIEIETHQSIGA